MEVSFTVDGGTRTKGTNETAPHLRLAVVFTDMEGSTELSSVRGDALTMELFRVHEVLVRKAAAAHDGRVVKSTGDGYLLAFRSSYDAVAAALEVRNGLSAHNAEHPDQPVLVRMGVNAGPVIEEGGDLYGLAVNAAARITAKAISGQVLVSDDIRSEVAVASDDDGWTFVDRGLYWLKGIREQWRLHEVTDGEITEAAVQVAGRFPFVDRDEERAALRRLVDAANDGRGSLVLVTGPPGGGKTRLVEEIGAEVQARGLRFFVGRCYEPASQTPYAPIIDLSAQVERQMPDHEFRAVIGDSADELARIVPSVARLGVADPAPEWPVQDDRHVLFAAVTEALARLAALRPVVLFLDDLQWADDATLRLLEHLAGQVAGLPVLIVCTYADDDTGSPTSFRQFVGGLHRRRLAEAVQVSTLGEPDVADLLRSIAGKPAPARLVALLHDATGGNPFFLEEVVRHLVDAGGLLDGSGQWRDDLDADQIDVPDSVRFTIESRLDQVSPAARGVLTIAAVIGRDFGFELLEELAELDEDALLDALDEAERTRLIAAAKDGDVVRFTFVHGLIRRTLASEVSLTRRQRMHLRIGDALERVYANELVEHAGDIAFHLQAAGRWAPADRTASYHRLAGDRFLAAAGYEEALRHFDRALALAPHDDAAMRAEMLEKMGMAERSLGHLDDALSVWDEALAVHDAAGARHEVARLCLTAAIQVAWWRRGREVMQLVERGLDALGDDDSALRAGLLALAGGVASQAGSYDQASRLLDDAVGIARQHGDDGILGLVLYSLAVHHFSYLQYENVVSAGRASMKHLRIAGDLWNLANVQGYVAASLGWLGRFRDAEEMGRETEPFARRLGNWSAFVFAEGGRAFIDIGTNPVVEALHKRGTDALELGEELGFGWLTSIGHARVGLAAFFDGRWEEALQHVDEAARGESRVASGGHLGRFLILNAYVGNHDEVLTLVDAATPSFPVLGRPNSGTDWTVGLAALEALAVVGERARAGRMYAMVVDYQMATGSLMRSWDYRLASTLAGIAAGCAGEWDAAESHFRHAVDLARRLPMRHEEADALRFHADMLLARGGDGDAERAGELLDRAAGLYGELGMRRHAELARSMRA